MGNEKKRDLLVMSALIWGVGALWIWTGDDRIPGYAIMGLVVYLGLILLYDTFFRPWRFVEDRIRDLERQLRLLDGRFARWHAFLIAPWLKGDVEKTRFFISRRLDLKRAELELFEKLKD